MACYLSRLSLSISFILLACSNIYAKKPTGIRNFLEKWNIRPSIGISSTEYIYYLNDIIVYNEGETFMVVNSWDNKVIHILQMPYANPLTINTTEYAPNYVLPNNKIKAKLGEQVNNNFTHRFMGKMTSIPMSLLIYSEFNNRLRLGFDIQLCINIIKEITIDIMNEELSSIASYPQKYKPKYDKSYSTKYMLLLGYNFLKAKMISLVFDNETGVNIRHPKGGFLTKSAGMSIINNPGISAEINFKNIGIAARLSYNIEFNIPTTQYIPGNQGYAFSNNGLIFSVGISMNTRGSTYTKCDLLGCNAKRNHSHMGIYYSPK